MNQSPMRITSAKGFCHRSYSLWRNGLSGLNFDLQSSESGSVKNERKCGLLMHASFTQSFNLFCLSVFYFLSSFPPLIFLPPSLFMVTPFYIVCYYEIYPFCPPTVFGFLQASLQDCPLIYKLSSHYIFPESVGCTILHSETKLLVLFLTSLYSCSTSINKD